MQGGVETDTWPYMVFAIIILTFMAWIEDIKKFNITFLIGNLLIFTTIAFVSVYCIILLQDQGGPGPGIVAYNPSGFWATVGFAIYSYEGIGIVMPVLATAKEPEKFISCLVAAIATLCFLFIFFGELTSLAFGQDLTEPFIT